MTGKRDIKILTELLDLDDVKVISHRLHSGIGMILQTESKKSYGTCPNCGTKSHKLHQNHRHIIKDLPFGEVGYRYEQRMFEGLIECLFELTDPEEVRLTFRQKHDHLY